MLTDAEIRDAISGGLLEIEPLGDTCLQPASYDFRVGHEAFVSGSDEKIDVANRGLVIIDPGEFAVLVTRERVRCGPQIAGQLGLESKYARQGLNLLSGPQVDPGFTGVLIVRVTNLAPRRITLAYEAPFLTCQFFKLSAPVAHPYSGSRQGQSGLNARDIEELSSSDSPTLGGMVKSLTALAEDVGELTGAVSELRRAVSEMKGTVRVLSFGMGIGFTILGLVIAAASIISSID